jgi:hypothetical protein
MADLDQLKAELARIFAAKERRRKDLAALPYSEKVKMVVHLQEMTAPILRMRGKSVKVWKINQDSVSSSTQERF